MFLHICWFVVDKQIYIIVDKCIYFIIFQTIRKLQMSESELERAEERAENAERSRSRF